jgi:Leucine-rich repeat (LRR) protein
MWFDGPLAQRELAGDEAGLFVRIHREDGVKVLWEIQEAVPPSTSARWQRIARLIGAGPEEWAAAAREANESAERDPAAASAEAIESAVRRTAFAQLPPGHPLGVAERSAVRFLALSDDRTITDLATLVAYPGVRTLYLFRTGVCDLAPLTCMTELEELNLADTLVADLGPIAACCRLRHLTLHNTQVRDLSPLAALERLESLDIQGTDVSDLTPIRGHTQLRELFLDDSLVTSLHPLRGFTRLKRVFMRRTKVVEVSPLADALELAVLALPPTITDLASLSRLPIYANLVEGITVTGAR